jgi:hypothetical protein
LQLFLNLFIAGCHQALVVRKSFQRLTQGEKMLAPVVSHQRFHHHLFAGFHPPVSQLPQNHRIVLSFHHGIENRQSTLPGDVTKHVMDLEIHLGQGFLHGLHLRRRHLHQTVAVTQPGTNDANPIFRSK